MTVNATSTKEFNVGQICRLAYERAGLLDPHSKLDAARARQAREFLDLILDELPARATLSRSRTFSTVTCTPNSSNVTLPSTTLDVNGDGYYIRADDDADNPESETLVRLVDQGEWHASGAKSQTGTPTRMYLDRSGEALVLRLLPTPTEAGYIRLKVTRLLADAGADSNTVDLERPWIPYLVLELGAALLQSNSLGARSMQMAQQAAAKLQTCLGFSGEHVNKQMRFSHRSGWRRR
jgi:hypothetical protein